MCATTFCEGLCGEEVLVDEVSACPKCGLDLLCGTCIGDLDYHDPKTNRLCGESNPPGEETDVS